MEKSAKRIVKHKWFIISIVIGLTVFFGFQIKHLKFNSDVISSLPDDDPIAALYKQTGTEFGGNEMGMVVLETNYVFKPEVLQHIRQITDSIRNMPGISTVSSLTSVIDIKSTEDGIEIGKLVDEYNLPETKSALDSLKKYIFAKEMYRGALVSEDTSATVILFTLFPETDKKTTVTEIKEKIKSLELPEKVHYGGLPVIIEDFNALMIEDLSKLLPIVFVIIAITLFIGFQSARGVVLPLLTAGIAVVWTLGLMSLTGYEISIISNAIPVVLLAVGTAYTIHVLNSIRNHQAENKQKAIIKALVYVLIPVILASFTTAIGFVSFVFGSYLIMIKEFGIFTAIGTLLSLLLSVLFVPAILAILPIRTQKIKNSGKKDKSGILASFVLKVILSHPKYLLASWILILIFSIYGIFQMETNASIIDYFKKSNPTRIAETVMQQKFGGSMPVFVVFEGDMQSPETLKLMKKTEDFLKEDPNINISQSVAGLIEQMNEAMGEGKSIPAEKAKIEQLWFLLEGQDVMPQLVSDDLRKGIIQSKFISVKSNEIAAFIKKMDRFILENSSETCTIQLSGIPPVYDKLNQSLIRSQFSSIIIAIILVILIVGGIFRSFSKGFMATIPIVATILLVFGFMGITAIPLDIATVLVASIALGIGIDYSIHVISGYNYHMKETGNMDLSIEKTINTSGKAIIINVISVAAGFIVLLFSQIVPLKSFGLLVTISMLGSGFGALTLLPAILILANRNFKIGTANQ
jgi:uncharacterized protein